GGGGLVPVSADRRRGGPVDLGGLGGAFAVLLDGGGHLGRGIRRCLVPGDRLPLARLAGLGDRIGRAGGGAVPGRRVEDVQTPDDVPQAGARPPPPPLQRPPPPPPP